MTPLPDGQIAALQKQVVEVGNHTRRLRRQLFGALMIAVALVTAIPGLGLFHLDTCFCLLFGTGIPFYGVAYWAAEGYRERRRRQLGQVLAELPKDQQAQVLLPLQADPSDDLRLTVQPLVRELHIGGELAPAAAPPGRGDEASPASEQP